LVPKGDGVFRVAAVQGVMGQRVWIERVPDEDNPKRGRDMAPFEIHAALLAPYITADEPAVIYEDDLQRLDREQGERAERVPSEEGGRGAQQGTPPGPGRPRKRAKRRGRAGGGARGPGGQEEAGRNAEAGGVLPTGGRPPGEERGEPRYNLRPRRGVG